MIYRSFVQPFGHHETGSVFTRIEGGACHGSLVIIGLLVRIRAGLLVAFLNLSALIVGGILSLVIGDSSPIAL